MKKLLLTIIMMVLMNVNAMAAEGKIGEIKQYAGGGISISFIKADLSLTADISLVGTTDAKKSMLAMALTAKTTGETVEYNVIQYSGAWGLGQLFYK